MINILFAIGNIIMFFGTLLLIRKVMKNKNMLDGYDPLGSVLTLIPAIMFLICYILMRNIISVIFVIPCILYWALVSFYTVKKRLS